jgi:hypothetical protein
VNVESLKNYGRPFSDTMTTLPAAVQRQIRRESLKVMWKHLGLSGLLRLPLLAWREKRRMRQIDLEPVRERGLTNQRFIDLMLQQTVMFSATARIAGMERALSIFREIMDRVAVPMNEALLPSNAEFERLDDLFGAFRKYMLAFFEAEKRAGLHEYRIAEDSEDALAVDVTYCAFCEIPKQLGVMEACESGCYSDEVFFPGFLEPFGLRFVRTKTLARKGDCCDFRFERTGKS